MKQHKATEDSTPDSVADQTLPREDPAPPVGHADTVDCPETRTREWHTHVDRFAVASLVCSLLGFVTGLGALLGIVFGLVARTRIKRSESLSGRRLAVWGILLGVVALATTAGAITILVSHLSGPGLAEQELLVPSDYPAGLQGQGAGSEVQDTSAFDGLSTAQVAAMERCIGISPVGIDTAPVEAASQGYADLNSNLWINDTVDVFPTKAAAVADMSAELNSSFPACQLPILNPPSQFVTSWGYDVGRITRTGPLSVVDRAISPTGTLAVDLEVSASFQVAKSGSGVLNVDEIKVEKGRSESSVWISNLDGPIPISLVNRMAHAAAIRLKY